MMKVKCIRDVYSQFNNEKDPSDSTSYNELKLFTVGDIYSVKINEIGQWISLDDTYAPHIINQNFDPSVDQWFRNHFILIDNKESVNEIQSKNFVVRLNGEVEGEYNRLLNLYMISTNKQTDNNTIEINEDQVSELINILQKVKEVM